MNISTAPFLRNDSNAAQPAAEKASEQAIAAHSNEAPKETGQRSIVLGAVKLTAADVVDIAEGKASAVVSNSPAFKSRIAQGHAVITSLLAKDGAVYGVTTGYGDSCTVAVPEHLTHQLPVNLSRFHGCGLGDYFSEVETRAILATRLASLCQGYSGVSYDLLTYLEQMLKHDILPRIPKEGSVGASGDLTPLSYVAGALIGERDVTYQGELMSAKRAFADAGLPLYTLKPKEGLALMNGTAVMTALACLAFVRAEYLSRLSSKVTAMVCVAANGNPYHFDRSLFEVKPHEGQQQVAAWLRRDLNDTTASRNTRRLQDRYSLRCAPHVIGALVDALPFIQTTIENELNSANDNPIVDPDTKRVLHGGHFYGGHIAMAMDLLKTQVANLADLHDRQMAMLMNPHTNQGLPANLSAATGDEATIHHGFKALQIGCSAWAAEGLKLTMPASVFSRSTECHNQDKVSMGTIAARDALRVLQLTEQVVVATMLASWQGAMLRRAETSGVATQNLRAFMDYIGSRFQLLEYDRPLEQELRDWLQTVQRRCLFALY